MSSGGPWSVKGIDPRARARAKTAARREGMTLGEWLNRVILEDGPVDRPDWDDALTDFPGFANDRATNPSSGTDDRMLQAMVDRLSERVDKSEDVSTKALAGIDRAITQLAERFAKTAGKHDDRLTSARRDVDEMRKSHADLMSRMQRLETEGPGVSDDERKTFDTTIMKLARRLYEFENETAARLHDHESRGHTQGEDTRRTTDALGQRLERLEEKQTEHLDTTRRAGDALRTDIADINRLAEGLRDRVESAERLTSDAARVLEGSVSRLDDRLRSLETRNAGDNVELERRFERLSEDVARVLADTRSSLSKAVDGAAREPRLDRLEQTLSQAMTRMDEAERRQSENLGRLGEEITRLAGAIDRRLTESERKVAETRSADNLEKRFDEVRQENKDSVKRMGEEVTRMGRSLAERMSRSEAHAIKTVEAATNRMTEALERIENTRPSAEDDLETRLRESEERTAQRIEDALHGVQDRLAGVKAETEEALSPVQRAMSALADRLEAIEKRNEPDPDDTADRPDDTPTTPAPEVTKTSVDEDPFDFDKPLAPPPQAETPSAPHDPRETDPFLAPEAAPASATAPAQPIHTPTPAPVLRAPQSQSAAPQVAAKTAPAQPQAPRRPSRLGATADADFLAAARERTRSPMSDGASQPGGAGKGRMMLYVLPLAALVMLGGAAAITLWDTVSGDGSSDGELTLASGDFVSQLEASLAEAPATATAIEAPGDNAVPATPAEEAAPGAAAADNAPAQLAVNTTAPANIVADASASILPEPVEVDAAPVEPAVARRPAAARNTVSLESAAADGNPIARHLLGIQQLDAGNTQGGIALIRRAAEQGIPDAQYRYAKLLETGEGVDIDLEAARQWTERAANAGHRRAMHNLGLMYYYGAGAARDYDIAARWFQEAALYGLTDSQFNLALLFESGQGVPQSLADAYAWYMISATDADPTAAQRASQLEAQIDPDALAEARAIAAGFNPRSYDREVNGVYSNQPWQTPSSAPVTPPDDTVFRAQGFLSVLGYAPGPIDGRMGDQTREAIMAFENDQGLPRTGRADAALLERLERAATG